MITAKYSGLFLKIIIIASVELRSIFLLNTVRAVDKKGSKVNIFSHFSMKTCCEYSLRAPRWGASNECP